MKFSIGQKVYSEVYGTGTVIFVGLSRRRSLQYGIKFDNGGPQGWAEDATNDTNDLVVLR